MTIEQIVSTQENIDTLRKMADQMADDLVQRCADYIIARCNNRGGEWLFDKPIQLYSCIFKGYRVRRVESHSGEFRNDKDYYMCLEVLERWDSIDKDFRWQYCDYLDFEGQHLLGRPGQTNSYIGIVKAYLENR